MKREIWKPIAGYEGLYEVSNLGNIASLNYNHTGKRAILKQKISKSGYCLIGLARDGVVKCFRVARLVAIAFIPNPFNHPQVNHINEIKTDNRVCNLEWVTCQQNINHGTHHQRGIHTKNILGCCNAEKPVLQIDLRGNVIKKIRSLSAASSATGVSSGHISSCCLGGRSNAGGFIWSYADNYDYITKLSNIRNGEFKIKFNKRRVAQYSTDGRLINEYPSATDAAKRVGCGITSITNCCEGYSKSAMGYKWAYI